MISIKASRIKQGIAPCRGMTEVFPLATLFLIFGDAIQREL